MGEKRRFIRFNILMDAICRTGGALKKLKVNNFSKEGVGILADEELRMGEDVEIEMLIPGDNIPVLIQGEVAWASAGNGGTHKGGIKFKKISNSDKGRILEHIYHEWIRPSDTKETKTEEK